MQKPCPKNWPPNALFGVLHLRADVRARPYLTLTR